MKINIWEDDLIETKIEEVTSKLGNIYIGGNVLYGIGLNDCTKTSKLIAEKIAEKL